MTRIIQSTMIVRDTAAVLSPMNVGIVSRFDSENSWTYPSSTRFPGMTVDNRQYEVVERDKRSLFLEKGGLGLQSIWRLHLKLEFWGIGALRTSKWTSDSTRSWSTVSESRTRTTGTEDAGHNLLRRHPWYQTWPFLPWNTENSIIEWYRNENAQRSIAPKLLGKIKTSASGPRRRRTVLLGEFNKAPKIEDGIDHSWSHCSWYAPLPVYGTDARPSRTFAMKCNSLICTHHDAALDSLSHYKRRTSSKQTKSKIEDLFEMIESSPTQDLRP